MGVTLVESFPYTGIEKLIKQSYLMSAEIMDCYTQT